MQDDNNNTTEKPGGEAGMTACPVLVSHLLACQVWETNTYRLAGQLKSAVLAKMLICTALEITEGFMSSTAMA